jgi:hypothetical protein
LFNWRKTPTLKSAPLLTLPEAEAAAVTAAYEKASVILEYGSGGSTALAASMPGKTVFSVESDARWAKGLRDWFAGHTPAAAKVVVHHADIGPTKKWGNPRATKHWNLFHDYPLSVWRLPDFEHPDVVLIDGRFRTACFLQVLFAISRPIIVLFDDYKVRPQYHVVEQLAQPVRLHGNMAEFHLTPTVLRNADLRLVVSQFAIVR